LTIDDFLSEDECAELIKLAEDSGALKPSWRPGHATVRTSESMLPAKSRVQWLSDRVAGLIDAHPSGHENPKVTRYLEGGEFGAHVDSYPWGKDGSEPKIQRVATVLIYLNTVEDGSGCTEFTRIRDAKGRALSFAPKRGQALVFFPSFADTRRSDNRVVHRSTKSVATKYVCQCWVCDRPTPYGLT
jgi:prolyl 4-hydroxylase